MNKTFDTTRISEQEKLALHLIDIAAKLYF